MEMNVQTVKTQASRGQIWWSASPVKRLPLAEAKRGFGTDSAGPIRDLNSDCWIQSLPDKCAPLHSAHLHSFIERGTVHLPIPVEHDKRTAVEGVHDVQFSWLELPYFGLGGRGLGAGGWSH